MEDTQRQAIPKFSTFRPKPQQTSQPLAQESKEHKISKKTSRDDRGSRSRGHRERDRSRIRKLKHQGLAPDPYDESALNVQGSDDRIFISDRRGDQDNVRYGSIHRYTVPRYNRAGSGSVLGADLALRIDRSNTSDQLLCLRPKGFHSARTLKSLKRAGNEDEIRVRPDAGSSLADLKKDYLSLDGRLRKPVDEDESDFESTSESSEHGGDDGNGGFSIPDKAKKIDQLNGLPKEGSQSCYPSHQSTSDDFQIAKKRSSLSHTLQDNPENAQAWLDLIQFESIFQARQYAGQIMTSSIQRSQADIKISLYEKALKAAKSPGYAEMLTSGLLNEARFVWDQRRIEKKWNDALTTYNSSSLLWAQHLDYRQISAAKFRLDDVQELYVKYFMILSQSQADFANFYTAEGAAYVLLRVTLLLHQADFTERAIAIWQANLEWHFHKKTGGGTSKHDLKGSGKDQLKSFEAFWDGESARIGEVGACGWGGNAQKEEIISTPSNQSLSLFKSTSSNASVWGNSEERRSKEFPLPARTTDHLGEDDPHRLVFFSDIEHYILPFSKANQSLLVEAFLAFYNLPPLPGASQNRTWLGDAFVRDQSTDNGDLRSEDSRLSHNSSVELDNISPHIPFEIPVQTYLTTLDVLFSTPQKWFSAFGSWISQTEKPQTATMSKWTQRILEALVESEAAETEYLEYYVAFVLRLFPDKARKVAKALLKKQQSNIRLYNVYALIEYRLGKLDRAQEALRTAIQMFKSSADTAQLRRTLVWETMELRGTDTALSQLVCTSGIQSPESKPEEIEASAILSLQKELLTSRDLAISNKFFPQTLANIDLLILLAYLTNPSPLEAALAIFTTNITLLSTVLPTISPHHETLHQSLARLLYHHATTATSFPRSLLRSSLASSIRLFPQNTIFLSLYAWNESRSRINDRVRTVVRDILNPLTPSITDDFSTTLDSSKPTPSASLTTHLFAIHTELTRSTVLGSNAYTVRAAFEAALTSNPYTMPSLNHSGIDYTPHSPLLWRQYFHFEIREGEMKRAKGVFYRAITACPWVKGLYLLAFRYLGDVMSREELRGVYASMEERELRIRVPYSAVEGGGSG